MLIITLIMLAWVCVQLWILKPVVTLQICKIEEDNFNKLNWPKVAWYGIILMLLKLSFIQSVDSGSGWCKYLLHKCGLSTGLCVKM